MVDQPSPGPREAVLGSGAGGPLSAPEQWITYPGYLWYGGGVAVGNGQTGQGPGSFNAASIFINGVPVNLALYFPYTGGTFTGKVTLAMDPTAPFDAVTKRYVDTNISNLTGTMTATFANYLPLAGGTMTGYLTLYADPTQGLQAATKQYVDLRASGFTMPDAPADGNTYGRQNATWVQIGMDAGTY